MRKRCPRRAALLNRRSNSILPHRTPPHFALGHPQPSPAFLPLIPNLPIQYHPPMPVKSFQAKIICDTPRKREYLWLTHRLFNEHLRPVLSILYAARRGKLGPDFKAVLLSIKNAQAAKEQIEAITSLDPA